ncbi:sigma factor-like helix-turn-helix DNA-binding protein [Polaromonas jejuensis]|uniref:Sigma factor-like helix-turn-helix DNA-binding protein n=1 Tax=Polaromonas jejuensis TaxID=457502 RepID=A0ABW0QGC9_9BURK
MKNVTDELVATATGLDMALDLHRCLMRLPQDQRAVLLLVSLEDMSYEEVARITGVPVGTVMLRLSRARARLRDLVEGNPDRATALRTVGSKPVASHLCLTLQRAAALRTVGSKPVASHLCLTLQGAAALRTMGSKPVTIFEALTRTS